MQGEKVPELYELVELPTVNLLGDECTRPVTRCKGCGQVAEYGALVSHSESEEICAKAVGNRKMKVFQLTYEVAALMEKQLRGSDPALGGDHPWDKRYVVVANDLEDAKLLVGASSRVTFKSSREFELKEGMLFVV